MASADSGNAEEELRALDRRGLRRQAGRAVLVTSLLPFLHIPLLWVLNRK